MKGTLNSKNISKCSSKHSKSEYIEMKTSKKHTEKNYSKNASNACYLHKRHHTKLLI